MNKDATSVINYQPNLLTINSDIFNNLWDERPAEKQMIKMFGKDVEIPRRHKTYGKIYNFNGSVNDVSPLNEIHKEVIEKIMKHLEIEDCPNSCLVNWYENGEDYIGYHSDDEKDLVKGKPIFIVTLGAERIIKFQDKKTKEVTDILLENNSLLIMEGTLQKTHKHSIPKSKKVNNKRISLTFRYLK